MVRQNLKFYATNNGNIVLQLEVNPLAETPEGKIYTADAKLGFDDNAQYRQKDIFEMEDTTESDPREVEAGKFNLNYVQVREIYNFQNLSYFSEYYL